MSTITVHPGDGTTHELECSGVADGFARGPNGTCIFCEGDPCAEYARAPERIREFYKNAPGASSCPICDGRPT